MLRHQNHFTPCLWWISSHWYNYASYLPHCLVSGHPAAGKSRGMGESDPGPPIRRTLSKEVLISQSWAHNSLDHQWNVITLSWNLWRFLLVMKDRLKGHKKTYQCINEMKDSFQMFTLPYSGTCANSHLIWQVTLYMPASKISPKIHPLMQS